jgi:stress-induced morphogen
LQESLEPTHVEISDESHKHGGSHAFIVTVVSSKFAGLSLIDRHRMVNELLQDFLDESKGGTVHALNIKAKTPEQWKPQ